MEAPHVKVLRDGVLLLVRVFGEGGRSSDGYSNHSFFVLCWRVFVTGFRDDIGMVPCDRRHMCGGLSSLDGLRTVGSHLPRSGIRSLDFSSSALDFAISPMKRLALRVMRHSPYGSVGLTAAGSPLPFGV